jgi:hypothetical protein
MVNNTNTIRSISSGLVKALRRLNISDLDVFSSLQLLENLYTENKYFLILSRDYYTGEIIFQGATLSFEQADLLKCNLEKYHRKNEIYIIS